MNRSFSEIVIEGPFMMVKGFLLGFLSATKPESHYFFHRKTGIRRETLKEFLKEIFELENFVHFCIETNLVDKLKVAFKLFQQATGCELKSIRGITSAQFSFTYEVFKPDLSRKAKELVSVLPDGVILNGFNPIEQYDEGAVGVEAYTPAHEYTARAKGSISGDFEGVIDTYLRIKRSDLSESVICGEVSLVLAD